MYQKVKIMSEVTFNNQSLTTDAVNYTGSVDTLKKAAKPFMNEAGVINITRATTAEDAKKIENCTLQIQALFADGKNLQDALSANPILGNKLANLSGCKSDELPTVLSDLNKSVKGLPNTLGSLLVACEDKNFSNNVNKALSAAAPFLNAVTDSDMRELLKLLIAVFAQLMTTQRENDLLNLNNLMSSFEAKLKEMETSRDKQYDAAMSQAVASIVMGCISLGMTIGGTAMQMRSAANTMKNNKITLDSFKAGGISEQEFKTNFLDVASQKQFVIGQTISQSSQTVSQMGQSIAGIFSADQQNDAKLADEAAEKQAMVMEIVRKAQEQNQSVAKALMDFINNLLSMIQQLIQNASQTEKTIAA
jgi:hypothetical protein